MGKEFTLPVLKKDKSYVVFGYGEHSQIPMGSILIGLSEVEHLFSEVYKGCKSSIMEYSFDNMLIFIKELQEELYKKFPMPIAQLLFVTTIRKEKDYNLNVEKEKSYDTILERFLSIAHEEDIFFKLAKYTLGFLINYATDKNSTEFVEFFSKLFVPGEELFLEHTLEYSIVYNEDGFEQITHISDLFSAIVFDIYNVVDSGVLIKKCLNCNNFFTPQNRLDEKYCNRSSPQDASKTCKEFGAQKTYANNLKNNLAMGLYRKIYMQKQMLAKRNPDISKYKDDFELYKVQSKQWKSNVKLGKKAEEEYIQWLKSIRKKEE